MGEFCSVDRNKFNNYEEAFTNGLMDESIFFILCITSFAQGVSPLRIFMQSTLEQSTELRAIGINALSILSKKQKYFSGNFEMSVITEELVNLFSRRALPAEWFGTVSTAIGQDFFKAVFEKLPQPESGWNILFDDFAIHNMFQLLDHLEAGYDLPEENLRCVSDTSSQ